MAGSAPLLIVAAGGTGGHVFPAQALAEEMVHRDWQVELWTDRRGARYADGFPTAVSLRHLPSASPSRGAVTRRVLAPLKIGLGIVLGVLRMARARPAAVAGFGGYAAFPALMAAWMMRVPRLLHEQNGVLGRANRLIAKRVNIVACGIPGTDVPPGARVIVTGNPVRQQIRGASVPAVAGDDPLRILVLGGSQGSRLIDHALPAAVATLDRALRERLLIDQQVRPENIAETRSAWQRLGVKAEIAPFFCDVAARLARSHLVICRAGASTVAELAIVGCPSILIPYAAAADDHQSANAAWLAAAGAAQILPEATLTPHDLARAIGDIVRDPERHAAMAAAAARIAHPGAARDLAAAVTELHDDG